MPQAPGFEAFYRAAGGGTPSPLSSFFSSAFGGFEHVVQERRKREMEELQKKRMDEYMKAQQRRLDIQEKQIAVKNEMDILGINEKLAKQLYKIQQDQEKGAIKKEEKAIRQAEKEAKTMEEKKERDATKVRNHYYRLKKDGKHKEAEAYLDKNEWAQRYVNFYHREPKQKTATSLRLTQLESLIAKRDTLVEQLNKMKAESEKVAGGKLADLRSKLGLDKSKDRMELELNEVNRKIKMLQGKAGTTGVTGSEDQRELLLEALKKKYTSLLQDKDQLNLMFKKLEKLPYEDLLTL
jgi:hypothetical protein